MPDKDDNHVVSQGASAEGSTHMPPLDSVRNDTVGDFRLLRKLGEGGMGLVYEAEQQHPHRLVALKIIRGGRYVDQLQIKMFEREAAALARLKHPGIATIYEMGHLPDGQPFFAMELVRGVALSEYVGARPAKDSALPRALRARLALFVRICDAVNYAHQRGVIHRDLKPSNILVTTASDRRTSGPLAEQVPDIKILDFGLARIADPDAKVTRTLLDSGLHGTLAYMSPEQTRGNPDEIDVRTDVYSLGVILYELVTGRLPYDVTRVSPLEALRIIADVVPPPPSRITGRAVDRDIDTIALRALEKEPRSRYQTALALAEDIERYLADQPILARSPTAGYQIKKLIKRHKMAFAVVAAGAALLVVFTVAMAFARERAVQAERRAEAEAETARQVSRFLVDLFKFSDPTEALGQRVTARELLDRGAQRIEVELGGQPAVRAALMETMGQAYAGLGLYDAGERLLRRAVDNRSRVAGPRHAEVAAAQSVLADVLVARGQYEEAESLLRNALAVQRAAIGNQAPITDTLSSLASLLHETGRYADAEVVYREALALRRSLLGNRHPDVAQSLNNLGTLYRSKAEYAAAEPLLEEALEMNRDAYGNDHPEVATSLNNLGMVLAAQGRYREADERLRESLAIRRKVLGDDHEETAISLNNVGYLLTLKGDRAASEPFYREALEIRQRVLGRDHPLVANTVNNLASALADRKDYEGADRLYREALSIRRSLFGDEHPLVAQSYNNLGTLLMRKASFDEAAPLFERAVGISRRVLGADHPETANYLFNQGRLARARKDPAAALRLFDDVLALRRKRLAADHPDIAAALFQKAQALIDLRRYADAERDALEALRINVTKMGDLHAATTATRQLLVTLYEKWQRPTEAAKYRATP